MYTCYDETQIFRLDWERNQYALVMRKLKSFEAIGKEVNKHFFTRLGKQSIYISYEETQVFLLD